MTDACEYGTRVGSISLFVLASVLYLSGICPTIYWFDSPEFVTTAHTLGISHPAGSPTYSLLAKLMVFLPLGNIALRVNAFSALCGACAVALLFRLLCTLLPTVSPRRRWAAASSGALFLLVSTSFWRFAEVAEVYLLQNYCLVLLLFCLLKARTSLIPLQRRYHWMFAFVYGLSAGVHATMALFAPAFLSFMGLTTPRFWRQSRALALLAFFFLLGFATYLYLPLRSLAEPAFNWGEPQTWQQFWTHVSDRKDAPDHTVFWARQLPHQLWMYLTHLVDEFSLFGTLVGLLGFVMTLRTDRALCLLLTLGLLGHTGFFLRTWWDTAWGFIPSFVIFALWIGLGTHTCLTGLQTVYQRYRLSVPRNALSLLFLGTLLANLIHTGLRHAPVTRQASNEATARYGKHLLAQLPADAILFCEYAWFPLLYLQEVERQRPDLTLILQGEVFSPEYFRLISSRRFPNVQHVTSSQPITVSTMQYFWLFVQLNDQKHALFWDPDPQFQQHLQAHLAPQGFLFRLHPWGKPVATPETRETHWQQLAYATRHIVQEELEDSTTIFLSHKLNLVAQHFRHIGAVAEASRLFQASLALRPTSKLTHSNYGSLLASQGTISEALMHFRLAYDQDPISSFTNKNLGLLMSQMGAPEQTVYFLERALAFGAAEGDVYVKLAEAYATLNRLGPALEALRAALQQYTQQTPENEADPKVPQKIALVRSIIKQLEAQAQVDSQPR